MEVQFDRVVCFVKNGVVSDATEEICGGSLIMGDGGI